MKKGTREPYIKVFKDVDKLIEMLALYKKGWSLMDLGRKFKADHSSIHYQVKKNLGKDYEQIRETNNKQRQSKRYEVHIPPITTKDKEKGVVPEAQGMDYNDYIKRNIELNKQKKLNCIVCKNPMVMVKDPEINRFTGYNWKCNHCSSGKMRKYTREELHNMDFNNYRYERT